MNWCIQRDVDAGFYQDLCYCSKNLPRQIHQRVRCQRRLGVVALVFRLHGGMSHPRPDGTHQHYPLHHSQGGGGTVVRYRAEAHLEGKQVFIYVRLCIEMYLVITKVTKPHANTIL